MMWYPTPQGPQQQLIPSEKRDAQWQMSRRYIRRWGVAMDCGAHVGYCTQQYQSEFRQVIAVEPNPTFQQCWHLNCDQLANAELIESALGHQEGAMRRDFDTQQVLTVDPAGEMPMITMDSLGIRELDFIKIDVDGSEARLLQGAEGTIMRLQPVIQIEIKSNKRPEVRRHVISILTEWGYRPQENVGSDWVYTR